MSLSFPVRSAVADSTVWGSVTQLAPGTPHESERRGTSVEVADGTSVFVGLAKIEGRLFGKVEANPSRFRDPQGCSLLEVDKLGGAVELMATVASKFLEPAGPVETWKVKRVDVARDFSDVSSPSYYVRGLAGVHRPHARKTGLFNDSTRAGAQTLMAGSKSGIARLYDQHAAYGESKGAIEGRVRWEIEARSAWLERLAGISTVQDLTGEALRTLAIERWEWSAMGVEVKATDAVVEKVMRAVAQDVMTMREARGFLGWMMMSSRGVSGLEGKETMAKYRRWTRELGVTLAPEDTAGVFVGRLDFESGREVLRVAA